MAESREETPSTSWQTETEGSGDDDMDFEVRQHQATSPPHAVEQQPGKSWLSTSYAAG